MRRELFKTIAFKTGILAGLIFVFLKFISCGRSAPPVAKDKLFPQKPSIKRAIYRDGFLFLLFKMEEDPYISYFSFIDKCSNREERVKFMRGVNTYLFSFQVERGCEVFVSARNKYGKEGGGILLKIPEEFPEKKVPDFSLSRFLNSVEIFFENPGILNIYRNDDVMPLNDKPLSGQSFTDHNVESLKGYRYTLRTVYYMNGIEVEGEPSQWKEVLPANFIVLSPPDELRVKREGKRLIAEWMPVIEEGLLGYNFYVYSKGKSIKINESPLKENRFEFSTELKVEKVGVSSVNKSGVEGEIRWVKIK